MTKSTEGPLMAEAFDLAAEQVGRAHETGMLSRSQFHLSPCGGCGAPSFQQPCMMCGFYPMGAPTTADMSPPTSREAFVDAVASSMPDGRGNLATWYLSSRRKTVAYKRNQTYRETVESAVRSAAGIEGLPDAGAVFDHLKAGGRISRPRVAGYAHRLWDVMFQLDMAVDKGREAADNGRVAEFVRLMGNEVGAAKRAAIDSIHSDGQDLAEAVDGLSNAIDGFLDERDAHRWIPVGNLNSARFAVEEVRSGMPEYPKA